MKECAWVVERTHSWINRFRRLLIRWEKKSENYLAMPKGDTPKWRLCVQIMPESDADSYKIHPFDLTKVWPHGDYPLLEIGILELNRNPESPANIVRGVGLSPNKMLQNAALFLRRRSTTSRSI